MTTSAKTPTLYKPRGGEKIPENHLAFARARSKGKAHSLILKTLQESGITKAELAKRLGKDPAQINRAISGSGNLTLETLSDLIFAIKGEFLGIGIDDAIDKPKRNYTISSIMQMSSHNEDKATIESGRAYEVFNGGKKRASEACL